MSTCPFFSRALAQLLSNGWGRLKATGGKQAKKTERERKKERKRERERKKEREREREREWTDCKRLIRGQGEREKG